MATREGARSLRHGASGVHPRPIGDLRCKRYCRPAIVRLLHLAHPRTVLYAPSVGSDCSLWGAWGTRSSTERVAGAGLDYWNAMYLRGVLIGMVAIALLLGMLAIPDSLATHLLLLGGGVGR